MTKEYKISAGANLGNTKGTLMYAEIDTKNYVYSGSIAKIFEDPKIKFSLVYSYFGANGSERDKGFNSFIDRNEEWNKWLDANKDKDVPSEISWKKMFEVCKNTYGNDFDNYVKNTVDKIKQEYSPMFNTLETMYNAAQNEKETPQKIVSGNGTADFGQRPLLLHNIPLADKEGLQARHDLGIIASEWFGKTESYGECRFCASFTKQRGMQFHTKEEQEQKEAERKNDPRVIDFNENENKKTPMLTYIIDPQTPAVSELVKMDLWQYIRNKENNNTAQYTDSEQCFLSQLQEWSDYKRGTNTAIDMIYLSGNAGIIARDRPDWAAVPAGIPSKNVIALQVKDIEDEPKMQKLIKEAAELYAVPVIDTAGKILYGEKFTEQSVNNECVNNETESELQTKTANDTGNETAR
jgi:hypothetical protein